MNLETERDKLPRISCCVLLYPSVSYLATTVSATLWKAQQGTNTTPTQLSNCVPTLQRYSNCLHLLQAAGDADSCCISDSAVTVSLTLQLLYLPVCSYCISQSAVAVSPSLQLLYLRVCSYCISQSAVAVSLSLQLLYLPVCSYCISQSAVTVSPSLQLLYLPVCSYCISQSAVTVSPSLQLLFLPLCKRLIHRSNCLVEAQQEILPLQSRRYRKRNISVVTMLVTAVMKSWCFAVTVSQTLQGTQLVTTWSMLLLYLLLCRRCSH